jgi:protein required for attachment to host cells
MTATWIVSANRGHAKIFAQSHANDALQEVDAMENPAARMREGEMETDDLGNRSASKSNHNIGRGPSQPSGYEPNQSPVEHETENFARRLAGYLEKAHQEGRFSHLTLVASPEFLGELRGLLGKNLQKAVETEIHKDYTHADARELRERILAQRH